MSLDVTFTLVTPYETMLQHAHKIAEKRMNVKLKRARQIIEKKLPILLETNLKKSLIYYELTRDISFTPGQISLFGALGIPDIQRRIDSIIHHWAYSLDVSEIPFKFKESGVTGGLRVSAILADYSDVLSLEEARAVLHAKSGNTTVEPWLEWLLLGGGGTNYIIRDFIYYSGEGVQDASRTNQGIMEKRPGQSWSIPPEYLGTQENNFLTQMLDYSLESISEELFKAIEKA